LIFGVLLLIDHLRIPAFQKDDSDSTVEEDLPVQPRRIPIPRKKASGVNAAGPLPQTMSPSTAALSVPEIEQPRRNPTRGVRSS